MIPHCEQSEAVKFGKDYYCEVRIRTEKDDHLEIFRASNWWHSEHKAHLRIRELCQPVYKPSFCESVIDECKKVFNEHNQVNR
jgi:hypothetical protein